MKNQPTTLMDYGEKLAALTSGKVVFACPNYAVVEAIGSTGSVFSVELPGPTQANWRRECAKIVRSYED